MKIASATGSVVAARKLLIHRSMMDFLFLLVVVVFFIGAVAYVEGCERL